MGVLWISSENLTSKARRGNAGSTRDESPDRDGKRASPASCRARPLQASGILGGKVYPMIENVELIGLPHLA